MLERSAWWLLPYGVLMVLMLHAMMEFSVSLLARRPSSRRRPVTKVELLRRLLTIDDPDWPAPLAEGGDCDLEIRWRLPRARERKRWAIAGSGGGGRMRLLLDESRGEVRLHEVGGSYGFFLGLAGWLPRVRGSAGAGAGPPGQAMIDQISRVALHSGWGVRPVLWRYQATHRGLGRLRRLAPTSLRRWPARRFWGVVYPVSFFAGVAYLVAILGPLSRRDWLLVVGVCAAWWGVWGLLVWSLAGFPALRKRGGSP